jgi:hypothetical protein
MATILMNESDKKIISAKMLFFYDNENSQRTLERGLDLLTSLLDANKFKPVDDILFHLDVTLLSSKMIIGILTITSYASQHLPNRFGFLMAAEKQLLASIGKERTEALLKFRR